MGDRCYAHITVRRQDIAAWEELGWTLEEELDDYAADMYDCERNYGVDHSDDDVVDGCPAYGFHGEGGDYDAMAFAWDGEDFCSCSTDHSTYTVVRWENGKPHEGDVEEVAKYEAMLAKVEKLIRPDQG